MNIYKKINHVLSFRLNRFFRVIKQSNTFNYIKLNVFLPLGIYDNLFLKQTLDKGWVNRINDVMECPDNSLIERHTDAGLIKNGKQVMHNGIKITLGGYYGEPIVQMLYKNKGVHEPQEEYAFEKVLKTIPVGATMIELGSYWSYYSIWFNKKIEKAKNYLVEPVYLNMLYGVNNFRINKVRGNFTNAFIGKSADVLDGIPVICVDDFVKKNNLQFIDILHADIQGFEYDMLCGAINTIKDQKIGYLFISTHGNKIHYECLRFLVENDFIILCDADEKDTYSLDGLIVARAKQYEGLSEIKISLKSNQST